MKVTIVGANGLVGTACSRRFLADGHEVHAVVRDRSRVAHLEPLGATIFIGELGSPQAIAEAARGSDVLVHAAGEESHRASSRALGWVHVAGTENVINAAQHAGVKRLVHISCADVTMHRGPRTSWNEDRTPTSEPLGAHAITKLRAEELVIGSGGRGSRSGEFETLALRPGLVWGPGPGQTIPRLCAEAIARGGLSLYGRGDNLVASIYSENLAHAVACAAEARDAAGGIYYVTDEELTLAADFYTQLSAALGLPPPRKSRVGFRAELAAASMRRMLKRSGAWPSDVLRRAQSASFDTSRATRVLGFTAPIRQADAFAALGTWAAQRGGPLALAALARPPSEEAGARHSSQA